MLQRHELAYPPVREKRQRLRLSMGLFQAPLQHVPGRVHVPIEDETAHRTPAYTHPEILLNHGTTSGAFLRRPAGVDEYHPPTMPLRLVGGQGSELTPCGAHYCSGEIVAFYHLWNMHILKDDYGMILSEVVGKPCASCRCAGSSPCAIPLLTRPWLSGCFLSPVSFVTKTSAESESSRRIA